VKPFLLVLSSPSGGGKSTIAHQLVEGRDDVAFSVSATTRPIRPGENDGRDYYFLDEEEFLRKVEAGDFLEWAEYGGYRYGTLAEEVEAIFKTGKHAVLDIEFEGARQVKQRHPDSVTVFLLPPSGGELAARLRGRETENSRQVARRLARAREELGVAREYDYVVINDDLVVAVGQVAAIVESESLRVHRHDGLPDRIQQLQGGVEDALSESPSAS